jgi:hypothetical protein
MPRRQVHQLIGGITGAAAAAKSLPEGHRDRDVLEVVGALLFGIIGGSVPDTAEPATSPNHRGIAHAAAPCAAGLAVLYPRSREWQAEMRSRADAERLKQGHTTLIEVLLRVVAGAPAGFLAGYASHLALDTFTPKSIALL